MTAVAKPTRPIRRAAAAPNLTAPDASGRDLINGWLASKGWRAWPFQQQAWDAYTAGKSGLIQVATGAGKTYGAYLGPLAELIDEKRALAGAQSARKERSDSASANSAPPRETLRIL